MPFLASRLMLSNLIHIGMVRVIFHVKHAVILIIATVKSSIIGSAYQPLFPPILNRPSGLRSINLKRLRRSLLLSNKLRSNTWSTHSLLTHLRPIPH